MKGTASIAYGREITLLLPLFVDLALLADVIFTRYCFYTAAAAPRAGATAASHARPAQRFLHHATMPLRRQMPPHHDVASCSMRTRTPFSIFIAATPPMPRWRAYGLLSMLNEHIVKSDIYRQLIFHH